MKRSSRPNILLIQADQWHPRCLSILGHPDINTPNLDRLAARGVLFTDASCNQPLCMPSRISMLSGQYPSTTRIMGNAGIARRDMPWLPMHLRTNGYTTAAFGKFHVASVGAEQWGFDIAAPTMPEDSELARPAGNGYENWCKDNGIPWPTDQMHCHIPFGVQACAGAENTDGMHWARARSRPSTTDVEHSLETYTTNRCLDYLREYDVRHNPFFIWLSYDRPHNPTSLPPSFYKDLHPENIVLPRMPTEEELAEFPSVYFQSQENYCGIKAMGEEAFRFTLATYFRLIEWIDAEIGRVMTILSERKLDETTAIIFVSDHGDDAGEQGIYDKLRQVSSETLTRVPLILRPAPAFTTFQPGVRIETPVELVDIFPTLCAWSATEKPDNIEGHDLSGAVAGAETTDPHRVVASEMVRRRMIRKDGWRLCFDAKDDRENLLFDMNSDPDCYRNLYRDDRFIKQRLDLKRELIAYMTQRIYGRYTQTDVERIKRGFDPADPILPPHNCQHHKCVVPYRAAVYIRDGKDMLFVPFYDSRLLFFKEASRYPLPDEAIRDDGRAETLLNEGLKQLFRMI